MQCPKCGLTVAANSLSLKCACGYNFATAQMETPFRSRAWSPTGILLLTVFATIIPGGILHALNYERLGKPELKKPQLITNLMLIASLVLSRTIFSQLVFGAINLLVAIHFYKSQEDLFKKHISQGGQKESFTLPIVLSIVLIFLLALLDLVINH